MGILDKLRPQSKATHPDPNIRIAAIHELDPGDVESLSAFAKDDSDARVRRVAVARIGDAAVLADIVRNESARQLRAGTSRTLGYVMLDATNPFFTDVAQGIELAAEEADLSLFLCNSNNRESREDAHVARLLQRVGAS